MQFPEATIATQYIQFAVWKRNAYFVLVVRLLAGATHHETGYGNEVFAVGCRDKLTLVGRTIENVIYKCCTYETPA